MKHVRQSLFPLSDGFGIKGDDVSPRPAEKFLRCFKREIFESMPLILAFVGEEDERDEEEREEEEEGERRTTTRRMSRMSERRSAGPCTTAERECDT